MAVQVSFAELVQACQPWPFCDPTETWAQHATRLWEYDRPKMVGLCETMERSGCWPGGAALYVGPFLQDGHHRVVAGLELGWDLTPVPLDRPPKADRERYVAELLELLAGKHPRPAPPLGRPLPAPLPVMMELPRAT